MSTTQKISGLAGALVITTGMVNGFAANAEAAPPASVETRSIAVSYADLDLNREAGVQALYQRLRLAARQACGSVETRDLAARRAWQTCRDAALANAVERLGSERVAAIYRADQRGAQPAQQQIAVRE
jgi:UrcA family protein